MEFFKQTKSRLIYLTSIRPNVQTNSFGLADQELPWCTAKYI